MADITIGSILKEIFYAAHARGVKLNYSEDNESKSPLTKRQADNITNAINGFLKELGGVQSIANIQFEIGLGGYVSAYRYGPNDPITLNLPCMRQAYNGKNSMAFNDYFENLKIALAMAVKIMGWMVKYNLQGCNVTLEYEPISGYEQYMKKVAIFEEKTLPQFIEKYKEHDLDLRLNSDGRYDFNYNYNAYNKKGRLSVNFSLGNSNECDFFDMAESVLTQSAQNIMEIVDTFLKYKTMQSNFYLDSYDGHIRKYYESMKANYLAAMAELTETLLKDTPEENLSVNFSINQTAGSDYSSYGGKKTYRFTLPYACPRIALRTESKKAPEVYKNINKALLKMIDWSKRTGIARLNFDRTAADKLLSETYLGNLLDALKNFVEEKVEIGQRANMTINIASPASYDPTRNNLSFFTIPVPDCEDDELTTRLPEFLAEMKLSS